MKVTVTIELELPDTLAALPRSEQREQIAIGLVDFARHSHYAESARWESTANVGTASENQESEEFALYRFHTEWHWILKGASWDFKETK